MRVILFDVDHGFCSFIRTPNGSTLLIDCGKGANFSPTKYLFSYEPCIPLSKLIITHPHDDHIEDFACVTSTLSPKILLAQNFNWNLIKSQSGAESHDGLDAYVARKNANFNGGFVPDPNYGMRIESFSLEPNHAQRISTSINSAVNNSSIVTIASFVGTKYCPKLLFGGDMEQAGWDHLLKTRPDFEARIVKLEQELAATKEYLQSVIETQEATNEELQSANEEILSSNEELQSTNEELETAKEELQSANEELTTVNDELRIRNLEITQVNSDLTNLFASIDVAVIMIGSDLTIRRFTPEAQKFLGLIPADIGRPLLNINPTVEIPNFQASVLQVMSNLRPVEKEFNDPKVGRYLLRILPFRTAGNKIDGAVITIIGVTVENKAFAN